MARLGYFKGIILIMLALNSCTTAPPTPDQIPPVAAATANPAATGSTIAASALPVAAATATPAAPLRFAGVEVNLLTFGGPQVVEPLQRRAPEFTRLTGANINIVTVPFGDLYRQMLTDLASNTNSYHAFVFAPQWIGDYAQPGYLQDLTEQVNADLALKWSDVSPFFRNVSSAYQGRVYTIPLDGDFQVVYYRSDLLQQAGLAAPKTWREYLAIARQFSGQDLNGDGEPDYGSCIAKARSQQSYWFVSSIASGYIQTQGTAQGAFFDHESFKPLVNNEAFAAALDVYKETASYGPPNEASLSVNDTRSLFTAGRCALSLDWGNLGTLALDPTTSQVQNKVGASILPGSDMVLDRATGKLVPCDSATCPYGEEHNGSIVNHAPFAAFGGWVGAVNAAVAPDQQQAAYAFLSYMSQPAQANQDVTIAASGFNPYRTSQFTQQDHWLEAGMSQQAAALYLGAIRASLESPNMVLDLRVPYNQRYQQVVLDTALAQFLAGEIDRDATMGQIESGWEEITEELGRPNQLAAYKATLGEP